MDNIFRGVRNSIAVNMKLKVKCEGDPEARDLTDSAGVLIKLGIFTPKYF